MTTIGHAAHRPLHGGTGRTFRFVSRIPGHIGKLWRAMRNRRSVSQLLDWDARMLEDIGLTRGDVLAALDGPLGDDPARRLSTISRGRRAELGERLVLAGKPKPVRRTRPRLLEI